MNRILRLYSKNGAMATIVETKYGIIAKIGKQKPKKYEIMGFDMLVETIKFASKVSNPENEFKTIEEIQKMGEIQNE